MLEKIKKVHVLACGGVGMSGLCLLFLQQGIKVCGSDKSKSKLIDHLVEKGLCFKNEDEVIDEDCQLVVYSSAIKKDHFQYQDGMKKGCLFLHRSEALNLFMKGKKALLVAGTHGKTTTSSLLVHALKYLGVNPSYAIGGTFSFKKDHAMLTESDYFVAEADESDGSFLNYEPYGMIVTNIDKDHMDFWVNQENLEEGFRKFINKCAKHELCCYFQDDLVLSKLGINGTGYGHSQSSSFKLIYDFASLFGRQFVFQDPSKKIHKGFVSLNGHHNALNSLGVFTLLIKLGFEEEKILEAFEEFEGVDRRCQVLGQFNNALWIDDYGHHPVEIGTTILGIKEKFPEKSMQVIFQPHRFSRTKDLWDEFYAAFTHADELIITDIYGAGEDNPFALHAETLALDISKTLQRQVSYISRDQLKQHPFVSDIVLTFGAGDIYKLYGEVNS
jgi:UDP-N-acetylmuramate--alanine ligase